MSVPGCLAESLHVEVYPTSVRSSGLAFCMTMGRLGAFIVPLTAELCAPPREGEGGTGSTGKNGFW